MAGGEEHSFRTVRLFSETPVTPLTTGASPPPRRRPLVGRQLRATQLEFGKVVLRFPDSAIEEEFVSSRLQSFRKYVLMIAPLMILVNAFMIIYYPIVGEEYLPKDFVYFRLQRLVPYVLMGGLAFYPKLFAYLWTAYATSLLLLCVCALATVVGTATLRTGLYPEQEMYLILDMVIIYSSRFFCFRHLVAFGFSDVVLYVVLFIFKSGSLITIKSVILFGFIGLLLSLTSYIHEKRERETFALTLKTEVLVSLVSCMDLEGFAELCTSEESTLEQSLAGIVEQLKNFRAYLPQALVQQSASPPRMVNRDENYAVSPTPLSPTSEASGRNSSDFVPPPTSTTSTNPSAYTFIREGFRQREITVLALRIPLEQTQLAARPADMRSPKGLGTGADRVLRVQHRLHGFFLTQFIAALGDTGGVAQLLSGGVLVATFNAHRSLHQHARWACSAALSISTRLSELLEKDDMMRELQNVIPIHMAIATGSCLMGSSGTEKVRTPVIVGDAIELALRLVNLNATLGTSILLSQDTYELVETMFVAHVIDCVEPVTQSGTTSNNTPNRITVYELESPKHSTRPSLHHLRHEMLYKEAFLDFCRHQYAEAEAKLTAYLAQLQSTLENIDSSIGHSTSSLPTVLSQVRPHSVNSLSSGHAGSDSANAPQPPGHTTSNSNGPRFSRSKVVQSLRLLRLCVFFQSEPASSRPNNPYFRRFGWSPFESLSAGAKLPQTVCKIADAVTAMLTARSQSVHTGENEAPPQQQQRLHMHDPGKIREQIARSWSGSIDHASVPKGGLLAAGSSTPSPGGQMLGAGAALLGGDPQHQKPHSVLAQFQQVQSPIDYQSYLMRTHSSTASVPSGGVEALGLLQPQGVQPGGGFRSGSTVLSPVTSPRPPMVQSPVSAPSKLPGSNGAPYSAFSAPTPTSSNPPLLSVPVPSNPTSSPTSASSFGNRPTFMSPPTAPLPPPPPPPFAPPSASFSTNTNHASSSNINASTSVVSPSLPSSEGVAGTGVGSSAVSLWQHPLPTPSTGGSSLAKPFSFSSGPSSNTAAPGQALASQAGQGSNNSLPLTTPAPPVGQAPSPNTQPNPVPQVQTQPTASELFSPASSSSSSSSVLSPLAPPTSPPLAPSQQQAAATPAGLPPPTPSSQPPQQQQQLAIFSRVESADYMGGPPLTATLLHRSISFTQDHQRNNHATILKPGAGRTGGSALVMAANTHHSAGFPSHSQEEVVEDVDSSGGGNGDHSTIQYTYNTAFGFPNTECLANDHQHRFTAMNDHTLRSRASLGQTLGAHTEISTVESTTSTVARGFQQFEDVDGGRWACSDIVLGKGAFGKVLLGMNESGVLVAIKHLAVTASPSQREEMIKEMRLLAALRHDNIVAYLGSAVIPQGLLIIMEYVPCGSLAYITEHFGKLSPQSVAQYARHILRGLDYLHSNGVVHRDVKPANLLLNHQGQCKLTDFGTADYLGSIGRDVKGTPMYMSPEAYTGNVTKASDIWAFGLTILQLLTATLPWKTGLNANPNYLMNLIINSTSIPDIPEYVPEAAKDFICICLNRTPTARPTARDMLQQPFLL